VPFWYALLRLRGDVMLEAVDLFIVDLFRQLAGLSMGDTIFVGLIFFLLLLALFIAAINYKLVFGFIGFILQTLVVIIFSIFSITIYICLLGMVPIKIEIEDNSIILPKITVIMRGGIYGVCFISKEFYAGCIAFFKDSYAMGKAIYAEVLIPFGRFMRKDFKIFCHRVKRFLTWMFIMPTKRRLDLAKKGGWE